MTKKYKLIIFDLDGTLSPERTSSAAPFEQRLLPGVKEKCRELFEDQPCRLAVATNQKWLYRDDASLSRFAQLRNWLEDEIPIDYWEWRNGNGMKPHPAMVYSLMGRTASLKNETLMVGDSPDDQEAAIAAGVDFEWAKDFFGWSTMLCGHDASNIVGSDEGTCHCSECEKEAHDQEA